MHRDPEVIYQELVESIEARQVERLKGLLGGGTRAPQRATKPKAKKPQAVAVGLTKPRTVTPIKVEGKGSQQNRPAIDALIKRVIGYLGGIDKPTKVKPMAEALKVTSAELVWPLRKLKQKKQITQTGQRNEALYSLT